MALQLSSPATAAAWCGLLTRRPFVVLSSTTGVLSEGGHLVGRGWGIRRRLLGRAAAIVPQTEQGLDELTELLPGVPAVVVPNPVESRPAPPLTGAPKAAFAGRLSEEKDLLRLLGAWESLIAERPEARLTVIGRGIAGGANHRSVESELRAAVRRSARLRGSVRLTGWLADPEAELTSADVFVFPSRTDTFGMVLLEAMASGLPVAALPVTGPVDIVMPGVTGILSEDLREAALGALKLDRARVRATAA
ncbi:MAG: glycosyltransferase [Solirubrobacteraceae bacterium]